MYTPLAWEAVGLRWISTTEPLGVFPIQLSVSNADIVVNTNVYTIIIIYVRVYAYTCVCMHRCMTIAMYTLYAEFDVYRHKRTGRGD